jgi:outer membrane protein OmpA-like peptidoglycan-associated protein
VNFDFDRAELTGEAESQLAALAAELTAGQWADAKVSLFGNTDTVGNPGYNEQLSAMRAANVRNWLTANIAALKADNISLAANGEACPIEEPRLDNFKSRTNRRVDIRVASYQAGVFATDDDCKCCCVCGHCHRPYWWDRHPSRN